MPIVRPPGTGEQIAAMLLEVRSFKGDLIDREVDGWLIRQPSFFEVDDHFKMLFAESRPGSAPLELPKGVEVCIAVIEGCISLEGRSRPLNANQFFVIRPAEGRRIVAIQHPCKLSAFFFREVGDGSVGVDSRQAD